MADLQKTDPRSRLTKREERALDKHERMREAYPLALDVALGMYELFVNGHSCEEIERLSKKAGRAITLGQIVDARLRYDWDERRELHHKHLFDTVGLKVQQTQFESAGFLADLLAVAHRMHGDKLKEYLQSGDATLFRNKPILIDSLHDYRQVIATLLQVTGQDKAGGGSGGTQVNVITGGAPAGTKAEVVDASTKASQAADLHKLLMMVDEPAEKK
jgi:hypothetical protein